MKEARKLEQEVDTILLLAFNEEDATKIVFSCFKTPDCLLHLNINKIRNIVIFRLIEVIEAMKLFSPERGQIFWIAKKRSDFFFGSVKEIHEILIGGLANIHCVFWLFLR